MKRIQIDEKVLCQWIESFAKENNNTPGLRDLYRYKGCPYNKSAILKEYGSLDNLYHKLGFNRKTQGYHNISDEELLNQLKTHVLSCRTTDRDVLRKHGCYDRSVYESRFGSWNKAIKKAGISNSFKMLMKYFDTYQGEDSIQFLKNEIGQNGDFTVEQKDLIAKAISLNCDSKAIRRSIKYENIKKHFGFVSLLIIACGGEPTVNYCSGNKYVAKDGHKCDSQQEVLIDDFLFDRNIQHEIHVKYPNSNMLCDFKVNDIYIEYAGLMEYKKYEDKIKKKIEHAKQHRIKQIILTQKDLNDLSKYQAALTGDC